MIPYRGKRERKPVSKKEVWQLVVGLVVVVVFFTYLFVTTEPFRTVSGSYEGYSVQVMTNNGSYDYIEISAPGEISWKGTFTHESWREKRTGISSICQEDSFCFRFVDDGWVLAQNYDLAIGEGSGLALIKEKAYFLEMARAHVLAQDT